MRYRSILLSFVAVAVLAIGGLAGAAAQDATPVAAQDAMLEDTFGLPELQITLTDGGFEGVPAETAAGLYVVTFTYSGSGDGGAVNFVQLPEERTIDDVSAFIQAASGPPPGEGDDTGAGMASPESMEGMDMGSPAADAAAEDPIAWLFETYLAGGPGAATGQTVQGIVELPPGNYAVFDDFFGPAAPVALTVTGDAAATPASSAVTADVTFTEVKTEDHFDFQVSGTLAAGPNLIQIFNDSDQPHFVELLFFPVPITEEQFLALLTFDDTLGTPPPPDLAGIDMSQIRSGGYASTQSAGSTQYLAVNLEPGTYALACFVPDPTKGGIPHAFDGMYEIVTVS
jgi:hypothetical protein